MLLHATGDFISRVLVRVFSPGVGRQKPDEN